MPVLADTFTEGSDTALGSHTLETRPGTEAWTVSSGTMTVVASADQVQVSSTGSHRAGIDYGLTADFEIQADLSNLSGAAGTFVYPGVQAYLSTSYDNTQSIIWTYQVNEQRYRLAYNSTNDGNGGVNFSASTPGSPVTLLMKRTGDTIYGYVDSVLRCTLDVSGTTDFSGGTTLYPGLQSDTSTGGVYPYWDNFSANNVVDVSAAVDALTLTENAATVTVSGDVAVSATTDALTLTENAASVNAGVSVSAGVDALALSTWTATVAAAEPTPLAVNASVVSVREGGHSVRYESLADHPVRNYRGTCISAITTARGYRRIWSLQTPPMTMAAAACFEADVSTGDLFTVSGFLVGSATLTAAIANIQREDEPLFASFSFDVVESL